MSGPGQRPVVRADGVDEAQWIVVAAGPGQSVPLTELRTHSATLEDVFVTLTGRHLRDE